MRSPTPSRSDSASTSIPHPSHLRKFTQRRLYKTCLATSPARALGGLRPTWSELTTSHLRRTTCSGSSRLEIWASGLRSIAPIGGFRDSLTEWGLENTEFGYRAQVAGALLVPVRSALAWHQGVTIEPGPDRSAGMARQKVTMSHWIAHPGFRPRVKPGRSFAVPQVVVSLATGRISVGRILRTAEAVLANRFHDLVVWIEDRGDDPSFEWLRRQLTPDPASRSGLCPTLPWLIHSPPSMSCCRATPISRNRRFRNLIDGLADPGFCHVRIGRRRFGHDHQSFRGPSGSANRSADIRLWRIDPPGCRNARDHRFPCETVDSQSHS